MCACVCKREREYKRVREAGVGVPLNTKSPSACMAQLYRCTLRHKCTHTQLIFSLLLSDTHTHAHVHTQTHTQLFYLLPFLMTEWSRMPKADPSSIPCVRQTDSHYHLSTGLRATTHSHTETHTEIYSLSLSGQSKMEGPTFTFPSQHI